VSIAAPDREAVREIRLALDGGPNLAAGSFTIQSTEHPDLEAGEVRVEVDSFSLDPYQSIRLRYLKIGQRPPCGVVGTVIESRSPDISIGQTVIGEGSWSTHVVLPADAVTVIEPVEGVPPRQYLGLLGLSGLTGYLGMTRVACPQPGEKLVVSGAFGGVGQVACQTALTMGADVVGLVGSDAKRIALEGLGVRAVNHRSPDWLERLRQWAPDGIDVFFDNVWGETAARVVELLRPLGRVVVCGQISGLHSSAIPPLPLDDWFRLVTRSLTMKGFRAADFADEFPSARRALSELYLAGTVMQEVTAVDGLDNAAAAFEAMMNGRTVGKVIVDVRGGHAD